MNTLSMTGKRGRPRKSGGSKADVKKRENWRRASKKYYTGNKKQVLAKAKKK